jgi:hypothetical protein
VIGRRLTILLVILAAVGVPAAALRAVCAGRSCSGGDTAGASIPFCPLPDALKTDLVAGFRQGRSPDVLAVTKGTALLGGTDPNDAPVPWPDLGAAGSTGVPIVFSGTGVDPSTPVPDGTGLDQVAPTIADVIGLRRPHPGVRSGVSVNGIGTGDRPRLVLEIALKGIGAADVADRASWPFLVSLLRRGTGTLHGDAGSLPLDPAATLTTIGTGGLPFQHGITGTVIRNDRGQVVRAWGNGAPPSVIAALPDDLDRRARQRSKIGLIATDPSDRGLIGRNWYEAHDTDPAVVARPGHGLDAARRVLGTGFGSDDVADLLGVVLAPERGTDDRIRRLVAAAEQESGGSVLVVVAGTGTSTPDAGGGVRTVLAQIEDAVEGDAPVVAAAVPGGLFLDQATLASEGITGDTAVHALLDVTTPDGGRMMADAFQGFAVSFARYC